MTTAAKIKTAAQNYGYVIRQAPTWLRFLVGYGFRWLAAGGEVTRETLMSLTEKSLLKGPLSSDDRAYLWRVVKERGLSPLALPLSFFRLPDRIERKMLHARAIDHLHVARMILVKQFLPPAERVLDLGGAVDVHPEGSLLAMGYPHRPKEVVIVDLPDDQRMHDKTVAGLRDLTTESGVRVRYIYSDMTRLTGFENESFDLVWSGQSIEHITEAQADLVIQETFRVLKPGGHFCLDTPNGVLMRLLSKKFLHPEHKIEYAVDHLVAKLRQGGFEIEQTKAITPCPVSLRAGRISKLEIMKETRVGEDASCGFSFFVRCRKPTP